MDEQNGNNGEINLSKDANGQNPNVPQPNGQIPNAPQPNGQPPYGQPSYGQQPNGQSQYNGGYSQQPYNNNIPEKKKSGLAVTSLVLGIVSVVMSCCCYYLSIPLGIASVIVGIISIKKAEASKGLAIAGIITGALGFVLAVVLTLISVYMMESGIFERIITDYCNQNGIDPDEMLELFGYK